MIIINNSEITEALSKEYRQYLTGHLKKPQPFLQHIDSDIEIGISEYNSFTADSPHIHPLITEYAMILSGCIRIKLLDDSNAEYELHKGDFFMLPPNTPYATKNMKDTRVLFIKTPSVNDKELIDIDDDTKKWLSSWE